MTEGQLKFYVIGDPIGHSLSPFLHHLFFEKFGIDGSYRARLIKTAQLEPEINNFAEQGVRGINITVPHKKTAMSFVDELTDEAKTIGCINTIKFEESITIGHNTDAIGFKISLDIFGFEIRNKNIILFGAGGAARAAAIAVIREKCQMLTIVNRNVKKAMALASELRLNYPEVKIETLSKENSNLKHRILSCQLLINATTVGMGAFAHQSIVPTSDYLHQNLVVYDLIYRPYYTVLVQQARANNVKWINGLDMLILQGFESLKFWLNQDLKLTDSAYRQIKNRLRRELCQE